MDVYASTNSITRQSNDNTYHMVDSAAMGKDLDYIVE